jgi:hypothetical protein
MTILHIAIEIFMVSVGIFAIWSIVDSFKKAWPIIKELFRD